MLNIKLKLKLNIELLLNERIKGQKRFVTGATSGIGQAIAAYLATEGANVALNYRNDPDKLEDTKELINQMCDQVRG